MIDKCVANKDALIATVYHAARMFAARLEGNGGKELATLREKGYFDALVDVLMWATKRRYQDVILEITKEAQEANGI